MENEQKVKPSLPVCLRIKNQSDTVEKVILFDQSIRDRDMLYERNKFVEIKSDFCHFENCLIESSIGEVTYDKICEKISKTQVSFGMIFLTAIGPKGDIENVLSHAGLLLIVTIQEEGVQTAIPIVARKDPYQQQTDVILLSHEIIVEENKYLTFLLPPHAEIVMDLYPQTVQTTLETSESFSDPKIVKSTIIIEADSKKNWKKEDLDKLYTLSGTTIPLEEFYANMGYVEPTDK